MKLSEIIGVIGRIAHLDSRTNENIDIRHLLTDSRQLGSEPEKTMFFAIKTQANDGARYIEELAQKGVKVFVTGNSLEALQTLASYVRQKWEIPVIGITGSNGKTVVKEWLNELLKDDYTVVRSPKSYNSQIGVPLSVWQLANVEDKDIKQKPLLALFEAGISEPGEMEKLEKIIRPTIGVITYIGEEHSANFQSLEQKRAEKVKLFRNCSVVVEDPTHQNVRTCAAVMRVLGYDEETIAARILHQTHETVMQINLGAMIDNVRYFRSQLQPNTRLTCMVKAFAYGAGSIEVSRALQTSGLVDYLAVAVADEGVELRKAGITLPILIMNPEVSAFDLIMENNLEPNIYSLQSLLDFASAAERKGMEHYPIHIKIDSGMHRLGFYKEDMPQLIDSIHNVSHVVRVKSVFSHLAGSDEQQWDEFTKEQIHYFNQCAEMLQQGIGYSTWRHILNSAGIERFSEYQMEMCRLGIGLYGFSAIGAKLKNVCTLKTTILSVKTVRSGETIGYGRHSRLTDDKQIAVIPIGYADGFDRRLSNYEGEVIVRGKRCSVVGNVCMDQAMIDVTGTDAQVGDQVILFGDILPIEEIAEKLGTIPYEILTSVSRRVKRVYY